MSASEPTVAVEEWRDIPKFLGFYQASSFGRIKSLTRIIESKSRYGNKHFKTVRERILRPAFRKDGHLHVGLSRDCRVSYYFVHQLVLLAFVGPCPEGMQCRHFPDDDPANNRLDNIQWGTPKQNGQDKIIHGTSGKGRVVPLHRRRQIAKTLTGKKMSAESRAKMSAFQKKRFENPEAIKERSEYMKKRMSMLREMGGGVIVGKKATEESRARMSAAQKGRHCGEQNAQAKLTNRDVLEIKSLLRDKVSRSSLAKKFGVGQTAIDRIATGRRWGHIQ